MLILGIFVLESVSVITQTTSYKLTEIFRMAPIHHHFELKGWAEPKIIVRFWIIALMLSIGPCEYQVEVMMAATYPLHTPTKRTFGGHDAGLLFTVLALMSIGVVMVFSSSIYMASTNPNIQM